MKLPKQEMLSNSGFIPQRESRESSFVSCCRKTVGKMLALSNDSYEFSKSGHEDTDVLFLSGVLCSLVVRGCVCCSSRFHSSLHRT